MIPKISEIGELFFCWDFDKEDYEEWLHDEEEQNTQENFEYYINNNVLFEIEFLDNETYHAFARETMYLEDIEQEFGEKAANLILQQCMEKDKGQIETCEFIEDDFDINNPSELNDIAKKLLQHGEYYKNCRGFILTDGTVVYTPMEHRQCTIIDGIQGTFHFISLGNIRIVQNSIDIGQMPTQEQERVLRKVIASYSNETIYLDIIDKNQEYSATYEKPSVDYVLGQIKRFFREGLKPMSKTFYEAKMKTKKILKENIENCFIGNIFESVFYPNADKVLVIKQYLDKNFSKQETDSLDSNGYPTKEKTVVMLSNTKQPLKTLNMIEFSRLLDDRFHNIIKDDNDRKKFLQQIIKDWYCNKIKKNGILTVNHL